MSKHQIKITDDMVERAARTYATTARAKTYAELPDTYPSQSWRSWESESEAYRQDIRELMRAALESAFTPQKEEA